MTDHPITPPPELIKNWQDEWNESDQIVHSAYTHIAICAAQWGADQELEACCKWLESEPDPGHVDLLRSCATALRTVRRPKPPSLKEQALDALKMHFAAIGENQCYQPAHEQIIRRALEQLDD